LSEKEIGVIHAYFLEKGTPEMRNWHGEEKSRQHIRHMKHLDITNAKARRNH